MHFDENVTVENYFSVIDIISSLGGIGAMIGGLVGSFSFLFIIHFTY